MESTAAARVLLTLAVLAMIALGLWQMRRGWLGRQERQSDLPAPTAAPAALDPSGAVPGFYVATTMAGDLLDRVVVHGLGHRGRAALVASSAGVLVQRTGEPELWIPRADLVGVRLGSGQAQKAFEAGGLILITWRLGDHLVETGFRADDAEQHIATASSLSALVPTRRASR